jgi:hypothetical protein
MIFTCTYITLGESSDDLDADIPTGGMVSSMLCEMSLQTLGEHWPFIKQQLVDHLEGRELLSTAAHKKLKELLETL